MLRIFLGQHFQRGASNYNICTNYLKTESTHLCSSRGAVYELCQHFCFHLLDSGLSLTASGQSMCGVTGPSQLGSVRVIACAARIPVPAA